MPSYLTVLLAFAWLAILAGAWLGWQLLRQTGRLLLRIEELEEVLNELGLSEAAAPVGLRIGSPATEFELADLSGETKSLAQFHGQPVLLIFFNPACGYCRDLAPKLKDKVESRKQKAERDGPSVLIASAGDAEKNREF